MNLEDYPEDCSFPTNTGKTQAMQMHGYKLHVMTHAPYPEDKSSLPNGVYVLKIYTELKDGSQNVSMVLRNLISKTIHLAPSRCVAQIAAANKVPEAVPSLELAKELAETQGKKAPKLTIEERQKPPYGVATTGWRTGTAQGMAVGTGPEI